MTDLHRELLTLDSHIDIPWPDTPDPNVDGRRRVDLPKMRRGGLWVGCFAAFIPQAGRDAAAHDAARARADAMLDTIDAMGGEATVLAASAAEIRAARAGEKIAVVRAIENGAAIGEDLSLLAHFRDRGVRYLTLVHNGHNALADSANPRADLGDGATLHGGLSPLGREAIGAMNRLGLLVDVSHLSRQAMLQAVQASAAPVVAPHSCVAARCPPPRHHDARPHDPLRATPGPAGVAAGGAGAPRPGGRDA